MYITSRATTSSATTAVLINFGDKDVGDILLVLVTYLTMFHQNLFNSKFQSKYVLSPISDYCHQITVIK